MVAIIEDWTYLSVTSTTLIQYGFCKILSFLFIVNGSIVTPAVRSEPQGSQEIHFTIGSTRWVASILTFYERTICSTLPTKKSCFLMTLGILHICLCPSPDFIKFCLVTHLQTYHQTIRHTFGTNILITSVINVCHIVICFIIYSILTTYRKKVTPHLLHLLVNLFLRFTQIFYKQVRIYTSKIRTISYLFSFKCVATWANVSFIDEIFRYVACNIYIIMRIVAASTTAIAFLISERYLIQIYASISTTYTECYF